MRIPYTLFIHFYRAAISVAALFSEKAKQWISGRHNLFENLASGISQKQKWIWFHAASLGEFEQGRPLIELVRSNHPQYGILLTFFSPSGYLVRKNYSGADFVTYMPLDTAGNAKRFIEIVKPTIAVFIKYEIWYHHLAALGQNRIPAFLISANLREDQIYFKRPGKFLGQQLRRLTHIFTQTESCALMLRKKGFTNVSYAGDTRVDRVLAIASSPRDFSLLKKSIGDGPILVAGSTWPEDEARLIPAILKSGLTIIIAPHEIHDARIKSLENQLPNAIRLSKLSLIDQGPSLPPSGAKGYGRRLPDPLAPPPSADIVAFGGRRPQSSFSARGKGGPLSTLSSSKRIVIVDTVGDLAHLYALADIAYVGGGFGSGIHNILEPAAHGIPVIFGPHHKKFAEAEALMQIGAARSIESVEDVRAAITDFASEENKTKIRSAINGYMEAQRGATDKVYAVIQQLL